MAVLEKVLDLQKRGLSESEITQTLLNENISPREISDAISQSKIKSAVGNPGFEDMQASPSFSQEQNTEMPAVPSPQPAQQQEYPSPQQYAPPVQQPYPEQQYQAYPSEQTEQAYYNQGMDLETIRDIAKREIETSMMKIRQQVDMLSKNLIEIASKMRLLESRISVSESSLRELNSAIVRKVGEYGEAITNISDEIRETQKSFAKIINPVIDKKRGVEESSQEESSEVTEETEKASRSERKDKANFERFLR